MTTTTTAQDDIRQRRTVILCTRHVRRRNNKTNKKETYNEFIKFVIFKVIFLSPFWNSRDINQFTALGKQGSCTRWNIRFLKNIIPTWTLRAATADVGRSVIIPHGEFPQRFVEIKRLVNKTEELPCETWPAIHVSTQNDVVFSVFFYRKSYK